MQCHRSEAVRTQTIRQTFPVTQKFQARACRSTESECPSSSASEVHDVSGSVVLRFAATVALLGCCGCHAVVGVRYHDGSCHGCGDYGHHLTAAVAEEAPIAPSSPVVGSRSTAEVPRLAPAAHLGPAEPAGQASDSLAAPHSRFHPVPTRPVFEPQARLASAVVDVAAPRVEFQPSPHDPPPTPPVEASGDDEPSDAGDGASPHRTARRDKRPASVHSTGGEIQFEQTDQADDPPPRPVDGWRPRVGR